MDTDAAIDALHDWLGARRRVFVLTGAGVSTASGIPDYRGADGAWKRRPPVTYQAFTGDEATRRRYWARSFVGWPMFEAARPNAAHVALVGLQDRGVVGGLLTQNVDGLHQRAGGRDVIDLHGRLDTVRCLACGSRLPRDEVQRLLAARNPDWRGREAGSAPDGDADVEAGFETFDPAPCPACGGMLKPDVVFFGENVPGPRVQAAREALLGSDGLLVVGSSLMVYSGYRFARLAADAGLPIAILTRGVTRADDLASLRIDADCTQVLPPMIGGR
ncbi:NAD-dependent protein deacetylase [Lysobacter humi (ex Lee et al. 2017)]